MNATQCSLLALWKAEPEPGDAERSFVWVRSLEDDGWGRDWRLAAIHAPLMLDWLAIRSAPWVGDLVCAVCSDAGPSGWLSETVQWCRAGIDGPAGLKERAEARAAEHYA